MTITTDQNRPELRAYLRHELTLARDALAALDRPGPTAPADASVAAVRANVAERLVDFEARMASEPARRLALVRLELVYLAIAGAGVTDVLPPAPPGYLHPKAPDTTATIDAALAHLAQV